MSLAISASACHCHCSGLHVGLPSQNHTILHSQIIHSVQFMSHTEMVIPKQTFVILPLWASSLLAHHCVL